MKKVIRLTESDLARIVRRVIEEQTSVSNDELSKGKRTGCYTIKSGDSALAVAKKFGLTLDEIKAINNDKNINDIRPGQTLRVQHFDSNAKYKGC
jgi:LysM repeat protein